MRCYDFEKVPDTVERATPRQRRLLGDLGYEFRPGSYFYVPEDQSQVIMQSAAKWFKNSRYFFNITVTKLYWLNASNKVYEYVSWASKN